MSTGPQLVELIQGGASGGAAGGALIPPAPIYFASTHGAYPLNQGEVPAFRVPENTYIFEASSVGEATLTTIDSPLWKLIQNRELFAKYVSGDTSVKDGKKKLVIRNLVYYKPGDIVYRRRLILEPNNKYEYNWGYFKFQDGEPEVPFPKAFVQDPAKPLVLPPEVPNPPYTDVMRSFREEHFPAATAELPSPPRVEMGSNDRFISETRRREGYGGPAIFIFSSCASYWVSDTEQGKLRDKAQIIAIGRAQQNAKLSFLQMFPEGEYERKGNSSLKVKKSAGPHLPTEQFAAELSLNPKYQFTQLDPTEEEYLELVGEENPEFVSSRFPHVSAPKHAATIFKKVPGKESYKVELSPSSKLWWTQGEIKKAVSEGQHLYISIGGDFQLVKKSGSGGRRKTRRITRSKRTRKTL